MNYNNIVSKIKRYELHLKSITCNDTLLYYRYDLAKIDLNKAIELDEENAEAIGLLKKL